MRRWVRAKRSLFSPCLDARDVGEVLALGDLCGDVLPCDDRLGDDSRRGDFCCDPLCELILSGDVDDFPCLKDCWCLFDRNGDVARSSSSEDMFRSDSDELSALSPCFAKSLALVLFRVSFAHRACFFDWTTTTFCTEKSFRAFCAAF